MSRVSFLFSDDDQARLERVCKKYACSQIQALRLGLKLLDENLLLQVELPPRRKPGPKPKAQTALAPR